MNERLSDYESWRQTAWRGFRRVMRTLIGAGLYILIGFGLGAVTHDGIMIAWLALPVLFMLALVAGRIHEC